MSNTGVRVEGELFSGDYLKSLPCWALDKVSDFLPTKNYCEKKPVLFYAWNRWCLNAKCAFGWMLDRSCPWHQSLDFIVRLRKQQLFCLKVGLNYVWPDCTADGTWLPLCMNSVMQLLTYMLQMVVCNQVHKAEDCSTGVQAMKSSLPALLYPVCALGVYMNEWIKGGQQWCDSL